MGKCFQLFFSFAIGLILAGSLLGQSPIVLRDLTLVRDRTVTSFDDQSIVLSDGSRLGWDQVLQATVADDQQKEFDRRIRDIGLPVYRLKTRIKNGDWAGAGEIAKPLYHSLENGEQKTSDVDTTYLVCLTAMKCRLFQADRSGALLPFLRAAMLQPNVSDEVLNMVAKEKIPARDRELKLSQEILPVWFNVSQLGQTLEKLATMIEQNAARLESSPGVRIYLASMKIELEQTDEAMRLIRSLSDLSDQEIIGWKTVLEARIHQKTKDALNAQTILEMNANKIIGSARPVAFYYRGINVLDQVDTGEPDRAKAMLALLRIPAIYGEAHRELSAAALAQSAEIAGLRGRREDEQKLRNELLRRYPRTYHGSLESTKRLGR